MSAPDYDAANELLASAAECVAALLDCLPASHAEMMQKRPVLVAGHALLQQLAALTDSLRDIAESLDYLAARPDGNDVQETIRHQQAARDYDWLKSLVHKAMPGLTEGEYLAIHDRIARMAGL